MNFIKRLTGWWAIYGSDEEVKLLPSPVVEKVTIAVASESENVVVKKEVAPGWWQPHHSHLPGLAGEYAKILASEEARIAKEVSSKMAEIGLLEEKSSQLCTKLATVPADTDKSAASELRRRELAQVRENWGNLRKEIAERRSHVAAWEKEERSLAEKRALGRAEMASVESLIRGGQVLVTTEVAPVGGRRESGGYWVNGPHGKCIFTPADLGHQNWWVKQTRRIVVAKEGVILLVTGEHAAPVRGECVQHEQSYGQLGCSPAVYSWFSGPYGPEKLDKISSSVEEMTDEELKVVAAYQSCH